MGHGLRSELKSLADDGGFGGVGDEEMAVL